MKRQMTYPILVLGILVMAACSTPPKQVEAPKPAEPPVSAADAASAIMEADLAVAEVKKRNNLWRDTTKILEQADNAMTANEYKEARDLANKAADQATAALDQFYRGEALYLITSLRADYMDKINLEQKTRLEAAINDFNQGNVQVAYEMTSEIMTELHAPMKTPEVATEAAPEPVAEVKPMTEAAPTTASASQGGMDSYTVTRNDTLWGIAAKSEVYGDVNMWPLLWVANKDSIQRPDDIAVGTKLVIDRSASQEAIAAAIKHSRLRGAESLGPVEAYDQQYLKK